MTCLADRSEAAGNADRGHRVCRLGRSLGTRCWRVLAAAWSWREGAALPAGSPRWAVWPSQPPVAPGSFWSPCRRVAGPAAAWRPENRFGAGRV